MGKLYLLRHAKSSWPDRVGADFDRPLAPRGRQAAAELNRRLIQDGLKPDLVLCSTARRTRETCGALLDALAGCEIRYEPSIYEARPDVLLHLIRQVPPRTESVMVIGHNPGLEDLADLLAAPEERGELTLLERLQEKFPTAALASFDVPVSWDRVSAGTCRLTNFLRPSD